MPSRIPPELREGFKNEPSFFEKFRAKRRLIGFLAGLGAAGEGVDYTAERKQPEIVDASLSEIPELPPGVTPYLALAGLESYSPPKGTVEFNKERQDRTEARNDLALYVREAMRGELAPGSQILDSCVDALQCYLFYEGQAHFERSPDFIAALGEIEGLSTEELRL